MTCGNHSDEQEHSDAIVNPFRLKPLDEVLPAAASLPGGVTLPAASLAWIAAQPGITTVIPGARNIRQASSNSARGPNARSELGTPDEYPYRMAVLSTASCTATISSSWNHVSNSG